MRRSGWHWRVGFTLIELLVAIAILSALMGMLLTALRSARIQARAGACTSGLRQLALSATLYADDNSGFWPHPDRNALPGNTMPHVNYIRQRPQEGFSGGRAGLGDLYPTYTRPELFYCPGHRNGESKVDFASGPDGEGNLGWRGWKGSPDPDWGHSSTKANYLYRRRRGYASASGEPSVALTYRPETDQGLAMIVDYPRFASGVWASGKFGVNHDGTGVNAAFADGAVLWKRIEGTRLDNPLVMDSHCTGEWWQDLDRAQ